MTNGPVFEIEVAAVHAGVDWKLVCMNRLRISIEYNLIRSGFPDFLWCCLRRRGGNRVSDKCPVAIADLVLMYNRCMDGLYGASKTDILSFDFFATMPEMKTQFTKYCKPFEKRLCSLVTSYRVIPVNEEQSTTLDITGFITEWRGKGKSTIGIIKLDLQSLEHHKTQYLDLHREMLRIDIFAAIRIRTAKPQDSPTP